MLDEHDDVEHDDKQDDVEYDDEVLL